MLDVIVGGLNIGEVANAGQLDTFETWVYSCADTAPDPHPAVSTTVKNTATFTFEDRNGNDVVGMDMLTVETAYSCGGQKATWVGTNGNDTKVGGPGIDVFVGLDGRDKLTGLGGPDFLCGNGDRDQLTGSGGDDYLDGGDGPDLIRGGAGDDQLEGRADNDVMRADEGDDILNGGSGDDLLGPGRATTLPTGGAVPTDSGIAILAPARSPSTCRPERRRRLQATTPSATSRMPTARRVTIRSPATGATTGCAASPANTPSTQGQRPRLSHLGGDDRTVGFPGDDILNGGDGDDTILGKSDDDTMNGGAGNDLLVGTKGDDTGNGGAGDDVLSGGLGNDTLTGNGGSDRTNGGPGIDTCNAELEIACEA